jgi:hypothetical protein
MCAGYAHTRVRYLYYSVGQVSTLTMSIHKGIPMNVTIDTAVLHSTQTAIYLANADRRIVVGFRAALEMLGLPVPEAALRRPSGRNGIAAIMKDYTDNNMPRNYDRLNDDILNHI